MQLMQSTTNLESTINTNEPADAAKKRIRSQPHLAFHRIWCEYAGGRLFLRGQVPSFYHKQLAQGSYCRDGKCRSSRQRNRGCLVKQG